MFHLCGQKGLMGEGETTHSSILGFPSSAAKLTIFSRYRMNVNTLAFTWVYKNLILKMALNLPMRKLTLLLT